MKMLTITCPTYPDMAELAAHTRLIDTMNFESPNRQEVLCPLHLPDLDLCLPCLQHIADERLIT